MPTLETIAIRRAALEQEIERLVDLLDAIDADPDLEAECEAEEGLEAHSGTQYRRDS